MNNVKDKSQVKVIPRMQFVENEDGVFIAEITADNTKCVIAK